MNYSELKDKYYNFDREHKTLEVESRLVDNPVAKKLKEHPCQNENWINYARDQKFDFSCLHIPCEDDGEFFKAFHENIDTYLEMLSVHKRFAICKHCGTYWTLDIQLTGNYMIYDAYGKMLVNLDKESDKNQNEHGILSYYDMPKRIKTVRDLMYVIDVIQCNSYE